VAPPHRVGFATFRSRRGCLSLPKNPDAQRNAEQPALSDRKKQDPPRDRVIADSGWGVKPDDQPANAEETAPQDRRYRYNTADPDAVRKILRHMRKGFNTPNRVLIEHGRTTIFDLNGDAYVVDGLSFGDDNLVELLKAVGAAFRPQQFRELPADFDGIREYRLTRTWAWGAERTG